MDLIRMSIHSPALHLESVPRMNCNRMLERFDGIHLQYIK